MCQLLLTSMSLSLPGYRGDSAVKFLIVTLLQVTLTDFLLRKKQNLTIVNFKCESSINIELEELHLGYIIIL